MDPLQNTLFSGSQMGSVAKVPLLLFLPSSYLTNLFQWESWSDQGGQSILLSLPSSHYQFIKARFPSSSPAWFFFSFPKWHFTCHLLKIYMEQRERNWDWRNKVLQSIVCLLYQPVIIWILKIRQETSLAKLPNICRCITISINFHLFCFL